MLNSRTIKLDSIRRRSSCTVRLQLPLLLCKERAVWSTTGTQFINNSRSAVPRFLRNAQKQIFQHVTLIYIARYRPQLN